ncbi:MAG: RtcB family protein [Armatimonadetes bacterium]|nr:RtcB family protein [Armatimonadota bacterium]
MAEKWSGPIEQIDDFRWRIPQSYKEGMRTDGLIYADREMLDSIMEDQAAEQVANVATLPGIQGCSMAMPDIHWGYGFPIGGVEASDPVEGVISPGGIGYDINCGVRMLRTDLSEGDVRPRLKELVSQLFRDIPSGVGSEGKIRVTSQVLEEVVTRGAQWMVSQGYGWKEDLEYTEQNGRFEGADPDTVSEKAKKRGSPQLGTLGSGNHFLEVQAVEEIYDPETARVFGIERIGQITVMIHTGSRGFGYQVCDDYLAVMQEATRKYGISLPDRQLACAPLHSPEAQKYMKAMMSAANYAWANRQAIAHWAREAFGKVFKEYPARLGMRQIYDVAHNIAKFEEHTIGGQTRRVCVHRKGATRAFPAGRPEIPEAYRPAGQPVLIPGDMGRYSYLLVGSEKSMQETFGTTCHGAGRVKSRKAAMRMAQGVNIAQELQKQGIIVQAASRDTLAEEASFAYKDVRSVVDVVHGAGISLKIARMKPLGVIKG